jgi:hypothetical protein
LLLDPLAISLILSRGFFMSRLDGDGEDEATELGMPIWSLVRASGVIVPVASKG